VHPGPVQNDGSSGLFQGEGDFEADPLSASGDKRMTARQHVHNGLRIETCFERTACYQNPGLCPSVLQKVSEFDSDLAGGSDALPRQAGDESGLPLGSSYQKRCRTPEYSL